MKAFSNLVLFLAFTVQSGAVQTFYSTTAAPLGGVGLIWNGRNVTTQQNAQVASTTIEFDVALQQIRVFGFVPQTLYTMTSTSRQEEQVLVGYTTPGFPNPPIPVPIYENRISDMVTSLDVSVPAYNFDTGIQSFSWDGNNYSFFSNINLTILSQIDASYSITADGTNYSGSDSFDMMLGISSSSPQKWIIDAGGYPSALSAHARWGMADRYSDIKVLADFTASNGTRQSLIVIPEPTSLVMTLLASGALLIRRKR